MERLREALEELRGQVAEWATSWGRATSLIMAMANDFQVGTGGSGNQGATNVWVGTGAGNQDAIRGYVGTGAGNQVMFLHIPGQPASFTAVKDPGSPTDQADLDWAQHATYDTAVSWKIERAPDSSGSPGAWGTIEAAWGSMSYTDTGLTPGESYWYRVSGNNYQGTGDATSAVKVTLDAVAPDAPTALVVTQVGGFEESRLQLDWVDESSDEDGFYVYRSITSAGAGFSLVHTTAAGVEEWEDTGLDDGEQYWYRVSAFKGALESGYTADNNHTELLAPSGIAVDNDATFPWSRQDITWTVNSTLEDNVLLYRNVDGGGFSLYQTLPPGTEDYEATGLTEDTNYGYKVSVTSTVAGETAQDGPVYQLTEVEPPDPPDNPAADATGDDSIRVSWHLSGDGDYYRVYGSQTPGVQTTILWTGSSDADNFWDHTGLNEEETWYYQITAWKEGTPDQESAKTSTVNATTWPTVPKSFNGSFADPDIDYSWTNGSRSELKTLQLYNWPGDSWDTISSTIGTGATSYDDVAPTADQIGGVGDDQVDARIKFNSESTYATDTTFIPT